MTQHHPLPTFRLEAGITMAQSEPGPQRPVTLDSPALEVMTDLTLIRAATTHPSTSLRQAEQMMIYKGVRMLFVVDDMPAIAGLITTTDLRGARPMQVVNARGLHFDELTVADVMTELDLLDAVGFDRLQHASVGDAVATLKRFGRNHLLVAEDASEHHPRRVRGLISRSQIERQLGTAIPLTPIASSFSEIERALN
jgi:CBS domain-containing protein